MRRVVFQSITDGKETELHILQHYTRIHPFRRLCQSAHPICVAVWGQLRIWSASSALTPGGKAAFDFPGELRRHFRASKSGFFQMRAFVLMSVLET